MLLLFFIASNVAWFMPHSKILLRPNYILKNLTMLAFSFLLVEHLLISPGLVQDSEILA